MDYTQNGTTFFRALKPESIREETKNFTDITGYVYVIQKRFSPDNGRENQPLNLIKIGFSSTDTRQGGDKGLSRLNGFLTTLIGFKILRLYLFTRSDFAAERADKKEEYARNANKLEKDLHHYVEHEFNPPVVRISFRSGTKSEWFHIPDNRVGTFLKSIDEYAYKSSLYTPIYGTAFSANSAKKITLERAPNITGIVVDADSGTLKEREQVRKTTSKYGYNLRQRKEADYKERREAEIKQKDKEKSKELMRTIPFWNKLFLNKTFSDAKMYDGDKGKYPLKIIDDVYETRTNGRNQPLVHYIPKIGKTRSSKQEISDKEFEDSSGSLTVNDMLFYYFKKEREKYKDSYEFYVRLNGMSDLMIGED